MSLWWPLAPGWWVVMALALVLLFVASWHFLSARRKNAYRRYALVELETIRDHPRALPALLKRVALTAYPRSEVAALSGERWIAFLNREAPGCFDASTGTLLISLAYRERQGGAEAEQDVGRLIDSVRHWIQQHPESKPHCFKK